MSYATRPKAPTPAAPLAPEFDADRHDAFRARMSEEARTGRMVTVPYSMAADAEYADLLSEASCTLDCAIDILDLEADGLSTPCYGALYLLRHTLTLIGTIGIDFGNAPRK